MDRYQAANMETKGRAAEIVMNPERLGAMHQTRISFVRTLIRKMAKENWSIKRTDWQLCSRGFGHAIYQLNTPKHRYNFVVFCDEIADAERNDRVIAEKWDTTFALVYGDVDVDLLEQLRANVPLQESGRNPNKVLVLARANKSVRVFDNLVNSLSKGKQPDPQSMLEVGYILRTTAVYGNGKFGIADFKLLESNPDFNQSFSAQMCAVYILRQFSLDWVNFLAQQKGGKLATTLHPELKRFLGVGNATGLGMAPYLINHPNIVDQWMTNRENALSMVLAQSVNSRDIDKLKGLLIRAIAHLQQIITINEYQEQLNHQAVSELITMIQTLEDDCSHFSCWQDALALTEGDSLETQEILITCLMELYPDLVDEFENQMNCNESIDVPTGKKVNDVIEILKQKYQWAIQADYTLSENNYWFWYRSQDKEEPRLGVRGVEPGDDKELPLDIGRQVNNLFKALQEKTENMSLAQFCLDQPQFRTIIRRVWTLGHKRMGDIQMNVLRKDALPMHLLRCKLSIFGATKFDPRSDRWVQVTFFQGAPLFENLHSNEWLFPVLPTLNDKEL